MEHPMTDFSPDVTAALASLRTRWGAAAPRRFGELAGSLVGEVVGALATVPLPGEAGFEELSGVGPAVHHDTLDEDRVVRTGFAELDAILGPGGIPRSAALALRGDASSGKTTLALRLAAEAQAAGSIVAYVDLGRSLDPVEAVARGVRLEWLVVLEPASLDEALAMAGTLVTGRAVDLLLVDLLAERLNPARPVAGLSGTAAPPGARSEREPQAPVRADQVRRTGGRPGRDGHRPPSIADRLGRLAALARRSGVLLVVLEPPGLPAPVSGAIAESAGLRLELARRSWIRLGRDVVGQRTEVTVARNRFGPPGRRAELRILYAEGGGRDACLLREPLLTDAPAIPLTRTHDRATPPSPLAASPPPPRPGARDGRPARPELRLVPDRSAHPRRSALDEWDRSRREPGGPLPRGPAGDAPGVRPPPRA
jgi:hypothetical protein